MTIIYDNRTRQVYEIPDLKYLPHEGEYLKICDSSEHNIVCGEIMHITHHVTLKGNSEIRQSLTIVIG